MRHLAGRYGAFYNSNSRLGEKTVFQPKSQRAIDAPGPGNGQVIRTALPDTFDGIRFEIGRMAKYVSEARRDPVVIDAAKLAASQWGRIVAQISEQEGRPIDVHNNKTIALEGIDIWCRNNFVYQNDPAGIELLQTPRRMIKMTKMSREVLAHFMEPFYKALEMEDPSFYRGKIETAPVCSGDCVAVETRVILRDRKFDRYVVKALGEVKDDFKRYDALSYNFETCAYEFKPIFAWHDKGVLPTWKARLWTGRSLDCTLHHKLWFFRSTSDGTTPRLELDIGDLHAVMERMVCARKPMLPVASKIPDLGSVSRPEELLWVEGLYAAEGWTEGSHTALANKDQAVIDRTVSTLKSSGIPYSITPRWDGVQTIRFKTSEFKNHLRTRFGANSFTKKFPDEYLSLSKSGMTALVDGYAAGDAYHPKEGHEWARFARLIHNTSSGELARQLMVMHSIMGRPLSPYLQKRHGGSGKSPIWRLMEYRLDKIGSRAKEICPGVRATAIRSIDLLGDREVCDITVLDNYNFVTEDGVIVKNCDEAAILACSMAAAIDITPVSFAFGGGDGTLHHTWARIKADGTWYDSDITEPTFRLGDKSIFDHEEEYVIPL